MIKNILGVSLLLLSSMALNVQAATLCSSASTHDEGLAETDVTFSGTNSADCFGVVGKKDYSGSLKSRIVQSIEAGFGTEVGNDWNYLVKDDGGSSELTDTYLDIEFTLDNLANGATDGDWELSWKDVSGDNSALPQKLDIVAVVKASDRWANYLLEGITFTGTGDPSEGSGSGTWKVAYKNSGGNIPAISGLWLFVRNGEDGGGGPPGNIPEPSTLFLGLLGLIGVGFSRRYQLKKTS